MDKFLHSTSAMEDEKLGMLFIEFGYEGIGLYWTFLERIAKQEKPVNTQVLKDQLKVGKKLEKVWVFMEKIELICSENGQSFSKKMLQNAETFNEVRAKNNERVTKFRKKISEQNLETTEKQINGKNVTRNVTRTKRSNVIEGNIKESNSIMNLTVQGNSGELPGLGLKAQYLEMQKTFATAPTLKTVYDTIRQFISENKPDFGEPYADIWNLVAKKKGLPQCQLINGIRNKKIKTRVGEPLFDFGKILDAIQCNSFYLGDSGRGWKVTFDYVIDSESNYLKILERS